MSHIRFKFSVQPASASVDAYILEYLQTVATAATEETDLVLKNRFWVAVSTFWLPHALQWDAAPEVAVRQAARTAILQGQQHSRFLKTLRRSGDVSSIAGNHFCASEVDAQLPSQDLPEMPRPFQLSFRELRETDLGSLLAYLSGLNRLDRQAKIWQSLKVFWYPVAYGMYGEEAREFEGAIWNSVETLEVQAAHLKEMFEVVPAAVSPVMSVAAPAPQTMPVMVAGEDVGSSLADGSDIAVTAGVGERSQGELDIDTPREA